MEEFLNPNDMVKQLLAANKREANARPRVTRTFDFIATLPNDSVWPHYNIGIVTLNRLVKHYRDIGAKIDYIETTVYGSADATVATPRQHTSPEAKPKEVAQLNMHLPMDEAIDKNNNVVTVPAPFIDWNSEWQHKPKVSETIAQTRANEQHRRKVTRNNGQDNGGVNEPKFRVYLKPNNSLVLVTDSEATLVKFLIKHNLGAEDIILYAPPKIIEALQAVERQAAAKRKVK